MFTDAVTAEVQPPTNARCAALAADVDALADDDPSRLGFDAQLEQLRAVSRLIDRMEAQRVRLLGVAERSGALTDDGGATATSWLRWNTTLDKTNAGHRARLARCLPDLPLIAAAFAAGDLGVAHAVQVVGLCSDVGVDQVTAVQGEIVAVAKRMRNLEDFKRMCTGWRHALRPDAADDQDERAYESRRLTYAPTFEGTFHLNGRFDALGGATLAAAINAFMHPDPPGTPRDQRRSMDQRRADALVAMAEAALAAKEAGTVGGVKPRVVVRVNLAGLISHPGHPDHHRLPGRMRSVTPPTLDWVGPIGPRLLAMLLDDCSIARVVFDGKGQPIDIGTSTRVWPAGMRRAIIERDRRCRFPSCDRPPEWSDIDHIHPWEDGGPTAVWNGLLLCRHHHRAKRRVGWWPTLHRDGTVTWKHADGRTRVDPAPTYIDDAVHTLLDAAEEHSNEAGDTDHTRELTCGPQDRTDSGLTVASETRTTYLPNRAPPNQHPRTTGPGRHPPQHNLGRQTAREDARRQ